MKSNVEDNIMLGILADSFLTATRTGPVWMRDARIRDAARPDDRNWYFWRGRRWRPIDPRAL